MPLSTVPFAVCGPLSAVHSAAHRASSSCAIHPSDGLESLSCKLRSAVCGPRSPFVYSFPIRWRFLPLQARKPVLYHRSPSPSPSAARCLPFILPPTVHRPPALSTCLTGWKARPTNRGLQSSVHGLTG